MALTECQLEAQVRTREGIPGGTLHSSLRQTLSGPIPCTHLVACLVLGPATKGPASHDKAGFCLRGPVQDGRQMGNQRTSEVE